MKYENTFKAIDQKLTRGLTPCDRKIVIRHKRGRHIRIRLLC